MSSNKRWEIVNGTAWLEASCKPSWTGPDQSGAEVGVGKSAQKILLRHLLCKSWGTRNRESTGSGCDLNETGDDQASR